MMLSGLRRFTKYINQPNVIALTEKIGAHYVAKGHYQNVIAIRRGGEAIHILKQQNASGDRGVFVVTLI
jgi:hypothetical protein